MTKKSLLLAAALCSAGLLFAAPEVIVTQGRANALYQRGEKAEFTIEVRDDGKLLDSGNVSVHAGVFGGKTVLQEKLDLADANPVKVAATLDVPDFLLLTVRYEKEKPVLAGAGFEPEKIELGHQLPADFKEFWEAGRAAVAANEPVLLKLEEYSSDQYTSFAVAIDVLNGEKLYGFLAVPNGDGPFPALVTVPGAGPGQIQPLVDWAKRGVIALNMNVHKYPVVIGDAAKTRALYSEYGKKVRYSLDRGNDLEHYHFRNVILGVDRMVAYVAAMPQWDKKHFVDDGSSQGGGMALIIAGFNRNITAAAANVPAICDHGGVKFNRHPGWPKLLKVDNPDPEIMRVSAYYDAGNFARFITCPVVTSAGFIDQTCSPASVYAVYNQIKAPKRLVDMPLAGHATPPEYRSVRGPWVESKLGLRPDLPPSLAK